MKNLNNKPLATYAVMIICFIVFVLTNFFPVSTPSETSILLGAYYKPFIIAGEYWRLLTVGFTHVSLWHLFVNMMALMNLGRFMEKIVGSWRYAAILLLSVIGGSAFYFITSRNTFAVGLSGGLYGLMAGYTLIVCYSGSWKNPQVMSALIRTYMINLMINFIPGVAAGAHAGGFFTGLLLTGLLLPQKEKRNNMHFGLALAALIGVMAYLVPQNAFIDSEHVYALTDVRILRYEKQIGFGDHAARIAQKLDTIYTDNYDIYNKVMED